MFLQTAVVLTFGAALPVVKIGRIAGQFAKPAHRRPRHATASKLPSYRGASINGHEFTAAARTPDPRHQTETYRQSAATLNLLHALAQGGYANLGSVHKWMLGFVKDSPRGRHKAFVGGDSPDVVALGRCEAPAIPALRRTSR